MYSILSAHSVQWNFAIEKTVYRILSSVWLFLMLRSYMCRVRSARGGGVKKIVSFLLHADQIFQVGPIKFFVRGDTPLTPPPCAHVWLRCNMIGKIAKADSINEGNGMFKSSLLNIVFKYFHWCLHRIYALNFSTLVLCLNLPSN